MNKDEVNQLIFGITALVILIAIPLCIGLGWGMNIERKKAIKANVGRYVVNPKNGDTDFVYGIYK